MPKKDKQLYFTTGVNIPDGDGERRFEKGDPVPSLPPAIMKKLEKLGAVNGVVEDEVEIKETNG